MLSLLFNLLFNFKKTKITLLAFLSLFQTIFLGQASPRFHFKQFPLPRTHYLLLIIHSRLHLLILNRPYRIHKPPLLRIYPCAIISQRAFKIHTRRRPFPRLVMPTIVRS